MARYVQGVVNVSPPLGSPPGWRYINMDSTLINNDRVFIDVTNGNIDLILPPTPVNASTIIISHVAGDIITNNIVVRALNALINDFSLIILDRPYKSIELIYSQTANRWVILQDSSPSVNNVVIINNDFIAENNDFIYVDTSNNAVEVTLPSNPLIGMSITIADKNNTFNINNCIINANSNNILWKSDRLFLDVPSTLIRLTYWNVAEGWKVFNIYANKWMVVSDNMFENINGVVYFIITNASNLENNQIYFVDTSVNGFAGKLPSSPIIGDTVTIIDKSGTFNTHNFILSTNGSLIEGSSENLNFDINNSITKLVYTGVDEGWLIFSLTTSSDLFTPPMLASNNQFNYYIVTDDQTLSNNDFIFINKNANSIILDLPDSPAPGDTVVLCDITPIVINSCTIRSGTHLINNIDNNLILDLDINSVILVYDGVNNWVLYYLNCRTSDIIPNINHTLLVNSISIPVVENTTLSKNNFALVNTTNSEITITLPNNPILGDTISILDVYGKFDTNNCIIDANGSNISGNADTLILDVSRQYITLIYTDSVFGWYIW